MPPAPAAVSWALWWARPTAACLRVEQLEPFRERLGPARTRRFCRWRLKRRFARLSAILVAGAPAPPEDGALWRLVGVPVRTIVLR